MGPPPKIPSEMVDFVSKSCEQFEEFFVQQKIKQAAEAKGLSLRVKKITFLWSCDKLDFLEIRV